MQNKNLSSLDSRWKRPQVYLNIVGIYLLVNSGISLIGFFLFYYDIILARERPITSGIPPGPILLFIVLPILIVVCGPSIYAGIKLLLQRKGLVVSLFSTSLWTLGTVLFSLSIMQSWLVSETIGFDLKSIQGFIFVTVLLGYNGIMYYFLRKGWNSVKLDQNTTKNNP